MLRNRFGRSTRPQDHANLFFPILSAFLLLTSLLIFPLHEGHCAQVTLAWDPDSLSDLSGYKIYYGTAPGHYQWNVDVGNVTTHTISGLAIGATYYAAATAYTATGLESTYSNEVMFTVPSCTYAISASNASFAASGGNGTVNITAPSYCNWTTSSSISWVTVTTGSGLGSGTMSYSVSSNKDTTSRTASFTIAGKVFTVTEAGKGQTVYIVTASAGTGGGISPSGRVTVLSGGGKSFTITPNTGYTITDVKTDGVSKGPVTIYTFSNVKANHAINVTFAPSTYTTYSSPLEIQSTSKADFNNDRNTDILWRHKTTGGVVVWHMNGAGAVSSVGWLVQSMDANWEIAGVGDFNNDGNTDILWRHKTTGGVVVWHMNGAGAVSSVGWLVQSMDANWEIAGVGDFNNDGNRDILWRHKLTGGVVVWHMNGAGAVSSVGWLVQSMDTNWEIAGVGDFNNDGNMDILWRHRTTGGVVVWYMNGAGGVTSLSWLVQSMDTNWEIVGVGDFNNDGNADIVWRHKLTGGVVVWYMNGAGATTNVGSIVQSMDTNWEIVGH